MKKKNFYLKLENVIDKIPNTIILIILGDLNIKIGYEIISKPTTGYHSLHEITNNNVLNQVDFETSRGLVIKGTMFLHKKIHKGTCRSSNGNYTNEINHVLIKITDLKTGLRILKLCESRLCF